MRRLIFFTKKITLRWRFSILFLIFLALVFDSYIPTINYLKFKYFDKNTFYFSGLNVRLGDGWYPIGFGNESNHHHITLIKINPWIPNGEVLSQMDILYQPSFMMDNSSHFRMERMRWGEGLYYRDREDVAFSLNGRLRIFFEKQSDLDEIMEISEVR